MILVIPIIFHNNKSNYIKIIHFKINTLSASIAFSALSLLKSALVPVIGKSGIFGSISLFLLFSFKNEQHKPFLDQSPTQFTDNIINK